MRGNLARFISRVFFLDLLVDTLGIERLVGILVEFRQLQLCSHFADRGGRLVDQFLIESNSIFGAIRLPIQRCQGIFGDGRQVAIANGCHLFEVTLGCSIVRQGLRGYAQKVASHVGRSGVRIFVDDRLKLFSSRIGALLGRSECRKIRLLRSSRRPQLRIHSPNGDGEVQTGLLVLRVEVVPAADHAPDEEHCDNGGNNESRPVLDRPIGGFFSSADGDTAKCILFQLMAGFCAHGLPF